MLSFIALILAAQIYPNITIESVNSVYDGDTFRGEILGYPAIIGNNVPIRIKGLDTPEIRGKCTLEKQKAKAARDYLKAMLLNAQKIELTEVERGKYFRVLAYVEVDGERVDAVMIRAGHARPYEGGRRQGWC